MIDINNKQSEKQAMQPASPILQVLTQLKAELFPHLLAGEMIASFFKTVSVEQPQIVVVIAPNHSGKGVKEVHTGSWGWQTPFGTLEAHESIINSW